MTGYFLGGGGHFPNGYWYVDASLYEKGLRKGWFSNTSFTTGLKTLPMFRPDALVFFRAKKGVLFHWLSGRRIGGCWIKEEMRVFQSADCYSLCLFSLL